MSSYPWLEKIYKKIVQYYLKFQNSQSIMIKSNQGVGEHQLIYSICKKILCLCNKKINFCNKCISCKLINENNHPDLHILQNNKKSIYLSDTKKYIKKIIYSAKINNKKILWIPKTNLLTNSSINTLLKILEHPPKKTWFFFNQYHSDQIKNTLISRCFHYVIKNPNQKTSLNWIKLKKNFFKYKKKKILIALNLSENSPLNAIKLIKSSLFKKRNIFLKKIYIFFKKKNFIKMLKIFFKKKKKKILWIIFLILDAIKIKINIQQDIKNFDQKKFINFLIKQYKIKKLFFLLNSWKKTYFYIKKIFGINKEFILLKQLLFLEKYF